MKYTIIMPVVEYIEVEVKANSPEEAKQNALEGRFDSWEYCVSDDSVFDEIDNFYSAIGENDNQYMDSMDIVKEVE